MPKTARIKPSTELRRLRKQCGVFSPTFLSLESGVSAEPKQINALVKALEARFENWWDSWVEPEIQYLEKRGW